MKFNLIGKINSKEEIYDSKKGYFTEKDIIIDNNSKVTIDELNSSSKTWLTNYMSK